MGDKKASKKKLKAPEHYEVYTAKLPDPMNTQKNRPSVVKNLEPLSKEELEQVFSKYKMKLGKEEKSSPKKEGTKAKERAQQEVKEKKKNKAS